MDIDIQKLLKSWWRAISLAWPVSIQQFLNTLMRTVDIVITGFFSPAAVAAVGLADLYAQIPTRIGNALGVGAISVSSQDTGRSATNSRDRAVTQAIILGFFLGTPFIFIGLLFGNFAIEILGAEKDVINLGGTYLMIIFSIAPMRIVGIVGAKSLQGSGDTRTPMYINGMSNITNIIISVTIGLGVGIAPSLGIIGVGIATAVSRTLEASAMVFVIYSDMNEISFARPRSLTITRQLVEIGIPNFLEGMSTTIVSFPFNSLVLIFGTEANAGYHVGRRLYHQLAAPIYRAFRTAASIMVGQEIGKENLKYASYCGKSISVLSSSVLLILAVLVFAGADSLVNIFTNDLVTADYAADFTRVYALSMLSFGIHASYSGGLYGAGDTKTPFYARLVAEFGFMLSLSYIVSIILGLGIIGVYIGIFACYLVRASIVAAGFIWGSWDSIATTRIDERANIKK